MSLSPVSELRQLYSLACDFDSITLRFYYFRHSRARTASGPSPAILSMLALKTMFKNLYASKKCYFKIVRGNVGSTCDVGTWDVAGRSGDLGKPRGSVRLRGRRGLAQALTAADADPACSGGPAMRKPSSLAIPA